MRNLANAPDGPRGAGADDFDSAVTQLVDRCRALLDGQTEQCAGNDGDGVPGMILWRRLYKNA
jgi:hypothetical protein